MVALSRDASVGHLVRVLARDNTWRESGPAGRGDQPLPGRSTNERSGGVPQGADGRLAMVTQKFNRLIQQWVPGCRTRRDVSPPQLDQDLFLRFRARIAVHVG